MTKLIDALTLYAYENAIPRFQRETAAQTRIAQQNAAELSDKLTALSSEAPMLLEKLKEEWDAINDNHTRATLLAGISIGLELGRL